MLKVRFMPSRFEFFQEGRVTLFFNITKSVTVVNRACVESVPLSHSYIFGAGPTPSLMSFSAFECFRILLRLFKIIVRFRLKSSCSLMSFLDIMMIIKSIWVSLKVRCRWLLMCSAISRQMPSFCCVERPDNIVIFVQRVVFSLFGQPGSISIGFAITLLESLSASPKCGNDSCHFIVKVLSGCVASNIQILPLIFSVSSFAFVCVFACCV